MLTSAASAPVIGAVSSFSCCSQRTTTTTTSSSSSLVFSNSRTIQRRPYLYSSSSQLKAHLLSSWTGLRKVPGPSFRHYGLREKKGKHRSKVSASLFGVGAPEALVIGVVALLVFGPKGLAEVARTLGKTLRGFQPTIRELQEVSREFKSTLEREIGLDEVSPSANNTYRPTSLANQNQQATVDPNGTPKPQAYTSEELLKITDEQLAQSTETQIQTPRSSQEQPQAFPATLEVVPETPSEAITSASEAIASASEAITAASEAIAAAPEAAAQVSPSEKTDKER